jgi:hypothetical protein
MDLNKLITRARALLLSPRTEWPVIATESTAPRDLYLGYVVWLAALPAVAGFLKSAVFGYGLPFMGTTFRVPIGVALSSAVVGYLLSLISVFLLALIADTLAPTFGGTRDRQQALKLAAYSCTAGWVGGACVIIPGIGWLLALAGGIYSIYLLYLGLPVLMKCAADRAVGYTAVIVIAAIVIYWIIGLVAAGITGRSMMGMPMPVTP